MAQKQQTLAEAQNPLTRIKKFPVVKALTGWNARHPLTNVAKKVPARKR